eukprot:GHVS01093945.1.p1 GENE.GHVS01093945.1~~GHVS01093945.1.p1  ORF type:complete len:696 (+),score=126.85 GHVS01093945.1:102-2189(+)
MALVIVLLCVLLLPSVLCGVFDSDGRSQSRFKRKSDSSLFQRPSADVVPIRPLSSDFTTGDASIGPVLPNGDMSISALFLPDTASTASADSRPSDAASSSPPSQPLSFQQPPLPPSVFTPSLRCPKDFLLQGAASASICVRSHFQDASVVCPKRSRLSAQGRTMCEVEEEVAPNPVCPTGQRLSDRGKCLLQDMAAVTFSCNKDMQIEDRHCVKTMEEGPQWSCPDGFRRASSSVFGGGGTVVGGDKALKEFGMFGSSGGRQQPICVREDTVEAAQECPEGYLMDSRRGCRLDQQVAPTKGCPSDFTLVDQNSAPQTDLVGLVDRGGDSHVCEKKVVTETDVKCPPSYDLKSDRWGGGGGGGMQCVRSRTVDGSYTCGPGDVLDNKQKRCVRTVTKTPKYECRKDFVYDGTKCIRVMEEEPRPICDGDMTLSNAGQCTYKTFSAASFACPPATAQSEFGRCEAFDRQPAERVCPAGGRSHGSKVVDGRCERVWTKSPSVGCPRGFKMNRLNQCARTIFQDAHLLCPAGSDLRGGRQCVLEEQQPAQERCPSSDLQLMDTVGADGVVRRVCRRTVKIEAVQNCPKGYRHDGGMCIRDMSSEPLLMCPSGGPAVHGRCTRRTTVQARVECPKNYVEDVGGKCMMTEEVPPEKSCDGDHKLVHDLCLPRHTTTASGLSAVMKRAGGWSDGGAARATRF